MFNIIRLFLHNPWNKHFRSKDNEHFLVNKYALTLEGFTVMIMAYDRFNLRISQNKKNLGDKNSPKHFLWIKMMWKY